MQSCGGSLAQAAEDGAYLVGAERMYGTAWYTPLERLEDWGDPAFGEVVGLDESLRRLGLEGGTTWRNIGRALRLAGYPADRAGKLAMCQIAEILERKMNQLEKVKKADKAQRPLRKKLIGQGRPLGAAGVTKAPNIDFGKKLKWCRDHALPQFRSLEAFAKYISASTMKPVELIRRALPNSSMVGDIVVDLFAGSGSRRACQR